MRGSAVIYQEPTLFPDLSVAENIFAGRQPYTSYGTIDRAKMRRDTRELTERLGVRIHPDREARGLSIADQQTVEIAKAISLNARVLIMDEPTAALSGVEVDRLMGIARQLRDEGKGIIFISHRFDEVFTLCDTITVMRDGAYVSTDPIEDGHRGRDHPADGRSRASRTSSPSRRRRWGTSCWRSRDSPARGLRRHGVHGPRPVRSSAWPDWWVRAARRSPAPSSASTGTTRAAVRLGGQRRTAARRPAKAMKLGMGFVPEDRRKQGLAMTAGVQSQHHPRHPQPRWPRPGS